MKKILSVLTTIALIAPTIVLAQAVNKCTITRTIILPDGTTCPTGNVSIEQYGMCCLLNTIYRITDWIFVILMALAAVFVILGGVEIVTAGGSAEKVELGRKHIISAAIGLIVAILAKAVPGIVKLVVGV